MSLTRRRGVFSHKEQEREEGGDFAAKNEEVAIKFYSVGSLFFHSTIVGKFGII